MSFFVLTERRAAAAACDSSSGLRSPKRVRVPRAKNRRYSMENQPRWIKPASSAADNALFAACGDPSS